MVRLPKVLDRQLNKSFFVGRCSFGLNCLVVGLSNACRAPVEKAIGLSEASLGGVDGKLRWMQDSIQILGH